MSIQSPFDVAPLVTPEEIAEFKKSAETFTLDEVANYPDPLEAAAFHGIVGEFINIVEPHTEADPAAILTQVLVLFGNCVNRSSFFRVGAHQHTANMFIAIVGNTSSGAKGTSISEARRLFKHVDPEWEKSRLKSGASSAEGVIAQVADARFEKKAVREKGHIVSYENEMVSEAAQDKRLVLVETEFSRTMRAASREGNVLTEVLRQAFESDTLNVLTKSPLIASDVHISMIAHITKAELLNVMSENEMLNGFANRFLWICSRRSRLLPGGGKLEDAALEVIAREFCESVRFARTAGELHWDAQAFELWSSEYERLSADGSGAIAGIVARARVQVLRLALIYALIDRTNEIRLPHLQAALALWKYSEASVRFIFGDAAGDPIAETILARLKESPNGLSRSEISELFSRNASKNTVNAAIAKLTASALIVKAKAESNRGRPAERWMAMQPVKGKAN
ncbi:MAG: DUF3987 domain-containing protein [Candidatus Acidiferrum sp.]